MKNNNQINIPQAREAMDKFKMQAASDHGVTATYRTPALLRCRNPKSIKNQRYAHPAAQPIRAGSAGGQCVTNAGGSGYTTGPARPETLGDLVDCSLSRTTACACRFIVYSIPVDKY